MINSGSKKFPDEVLAVLSVLDAKEFNYQVRAFEAPAHHAREAAALLDCPIGAIIKSLMFKTRGHDKYILVLVSGQNRADRKKLSKIIGEQVVKAQPDEVLIETGYPVGAVPPFAVDYNFQVIIDKELMSFQNLWASAGSGHILVSFESSNLKDLTGGWIFDIKEI